MKLVTRSSVVFACHTAACRPPQSGGTGGSRGGGATQGHLDQYHGGKASGTVKAHLEMVYGKGNVPRKLPSSNDKPKGYYGSRDRGLIVHHNPG